MADSTAPLNDDASATGSETNTSIVPLTSTTSDHHSATMPSRPVHKARPSSLSVSSVQRFKKRIPWRGKTCVICLPSSYNRIDFTEYAKDHLPLILPDSEVQARPSHPDPEEINAERAERSFRIKLPEQTSWDYVKESQEAKLRALGVGPGFEEPQGSIPSGASSSLKWHMSSQTRSLPVSPSVVPPYILESLTKHAYGVPCRPQDTHESGLPASSASTIDSQQFTQPSVKHFPRFSMSNFRHSPEIALPNGFDSSRYAPSPIASSITPTLQGSVPPLYRSNSATEKSTARSPESSFPPHYLGDRPSGPNKQQSTMQNERHRERQGGSTLSYDQRTSESSKGEPAFQHPVPRSYRNSVPEQLERRLHEAEGDSQQDHEPRLGNKQVEIMTQASKLEPVQTSKTPNSLDDVNSRRFLVEAESLPKKTGRSVSGMNALATEFKVEYSTPRSTSSAASTTTMRPTAPAFTPASTIQQLPASHQFTFLSTGPIFRPATTVVQTTKNSKAIDIRTPKDEWSMGTPDGEVQEDESGRITQAEGRQKRQRRTSEDGFQDALFVSSGDGPSSAVEQHLKSGDVDSLRTKYQHGRHGSESLEKATQAANQLRQIIDDFSTSEDSSSLVQTAENANPDETANTFRDSTEDAMSDTANGSFEKHQGAADDLPTTYGSSLRRATSSITSSPSEDNDDPQQSGPLHRRGSSPTQHDSKLSDLDSPGRVSAERSGLRIAQMENKTSGHKGHKLEEEGIDGLSSTDPASEKHKADVKHANDEDPSRRTSDRDMHCRSQIPDRISTHDFQTPKSELHVDTNFQYLPPGESESVNSSVVRLVAENARFSPSYRPSYASDGPLPVNGLGSADSAAISAWDKGLSSSEEAQSDHEQAILEASVHDVIGKVLEDRLVPLTESLASIRNSLLELAKQTPSRTDLSNPQGTADSSDADDEEDANYTESIIKSPTRDRKTEKLKAMMREVLATQPKVVPTNDLETIVATVKELKDSFQGSGPPPADVKIAVEEAIGRQMRGRSGPITSSHQSATVEKSQLQIAGLESMLKIAEGRAEDEMKARRATEDALADSQRLLRLALQDAAEQRESAEETEHSLSAFHEERHELLRRNALLEGAQESFQRTASELTEKNTALEGTLEEYRLSSAQWREEIESAKMENNDLRRTVNALRTEMEEGIDGRQVLQAKFDHLQDGMAAVSQNIAQDQSLWRIKEEEYKARCEVLIADGGRLSQSCEDMSAKITTLSEKLRLSEDDYHHATAQLERRLDDQTKRANLERDRLQTSIDNESRAMASKLDDAHTTSEGIVTSIKSQLERVTDAARTDRVVLEEQLQKATALGAAAIETYQAFHDKEVGSLKGLNEQMEIQCRDRLQLAEEKLSLYQDKVEILEEKLEVAKSAAQAAAQAARLNRSASKGAQSGHLFGSGSMSSPPAKTSPQALRESILVLQEQLQDREMQIEELQQRLAAVDTEAPAKVKAQETEITWLRELLGVRVDDLEDLIAALSRPVHDREAIKDAAIRIKANIEMEQQEKERQGSQSLRSLATISSLTSSPRSLPLAAAAAWGNWRKGRIAPVPKLFSSANGHATETPSRLSSSAQRVMSGLMTPPHTEVRREDGSGGDSPDVKPPSRKRPTSSTPQQEAELPRRDITLQRSRRPVTPSLTRRSNYDMDAESTDLAQFHSTIEVGHGEDEEPFGPRIASFSSHA
ncbi:MAG: hypothetical protein Q9168_002416 [Polycauliona sp. 1 TL-2023]